MRVAGGETGLEFKWETILGPSSPEAREVWMKQMTLWRDAERANVHFDGSQYDRPELKWAQASFIQAQMAAVMVRVSVASGMRIRVNR